MACHLKIFNIYLFTLFAFISLYNIILAICKAKYFFRLIKF